MTRLPRLPWGQFFAVWDASPQEEEASQHRMLPLTGLMYSEQTGSHYPKEVGRPMGTFFAVRDPPPQQEEAFKHTVLPLTWLIYCEQTGSYSPDKVGE